MYTPHTVTIYNAYENAETLRNEYTITVLDGVFLDISKGANVMRSGLENIDSATLFIPFGIKAINGITGEEQTYIEPKEYMRLSDKGAYWTIRSGGSSSNKDCFFVRGKVVDNSGFQEIDSKHDNVFRVSSVDLRDFGDGRNRHWEVGGR